ncbi:XRE family transcriptional regulator [endosymbiont GvMRE of Glomus versiforme]|uniref:XRE family transcriptional regulator n=1 Tax=endosymbiont GvMRE of Glomus versiforme TaxID=2039283 RepID=UPI000ED5C34F|nr:XRE family transcriptional regulator [endosymbiont GvMRE of Glomus versiforme]RHZ35846.1 hypothetical protein GvMRE_Ic4g27 [endosymbiont GvMRE of Glomus versiforme]
MSDNQKRPTFPSEEEIENITNYFSDSNCKDINEGLKSNASELDKIKYSLCQSISRYKRENKLTPNELARKLEINEDKAENILYGRISKFKLNELKSLHQKNAREEKDKLIDYNSELNDLILFTEKLGIENTDFVDIPFSQVPNQITSRFPHIKIKKKYERAWISK